VAYCTYMGVGKAILLLIAWSCFADPHVALEQCVQHEHVLNQHITSLSNHINTNNKKLGCRRQAARPHSSLLWRLLPKSSCLSEECKIRDFWLQAFSVDVLSGQIDAQIRREWIERVNARSAMNFSVDFYRAMHFSAKRGIAIACRLSVCLSVCL